MISSDPYYSRTTLLLHCDGANNSTLFEDSSPAARIITRVGNPIISTDQSVAGGSSGYLNGSSRLDVGVLSLASLSLFTVDGFFRTPIVGLAYCAERDTGAYGWVLGSHSLRAVVNGVWSDLQMEWAPPAINMFHHVALVRNLSVVAVYFGGIRVGQLTGVTSFGTAGHTLRIGAASNGSESPMTGYFDEMRVTLGVARYTANFTPPGVPFSSQAPLPTVSVGF